MKQLPKVAAGIAMWGALAAQAQNLVTNGDFSSLTNNAGTAVTALDNYIINSSAANGGNPIGYYISTGFNLTGWTNSSFVGVVYGSGIGDSADHHPLLGPDHSTPNKRYAPWILRGSQDGTVWDKDYPVTAESPAGGNYFGADGNYGQGVLKQTISGLVPGQAYQLSFWSSGGTLLTGGGAGTDSASWVVKLGSGSVYDVNTTVSTGQYSAVGGIAPWVQTVVNFTASTSTEVLSFAAGGGGSPPMALLDGVSITAVPEPEQWAMLGAGLLIIGGVQLRRRRRLH